MHRRHLLAAGGVGTLQALAASAHAEGPGASAQGVADAWLAGLPLVEMAAARARMLNPVGPGQKAGLNAFRHTRDLVGAGDETITTPNNDTLYSNAFIDLTRGPATLTVPEAHGRYLSVAVMDFYTNNNVILGARTAGGAAGTYTLVGPGAQAPGGPRVLRIATPHAWVLARVLVDSPQDLPAARRVQDGLALRGPPAGPYPAYARRSDPARAYFETVARLVAEEPPGSRAGMGALGSAPSLDPSVVEAGVAQARRFLTDGRARMLNFQNGWQYPRATLGDYGDDFRYRAVVAVGGLGALKPSEAMYMRAQGDTGRAVFEGDGLFRLALPGAVPVDAFWSLSMYRATPDGQFFFAENPIRRFAIGDRTPGLRKAPNGAVEIWIGRNDPGGERTSNWLPAPAAGPYMLSLRAYLPRAEMRDGRYRLPPITPA